ncbi:MAG: prepilin-type N-terminal cleavage/methylation domain-containing protein [Planctomycetes bacterium]|nr:prepilin-type N-terminal cleavage/methylation domain-containing protein [Planctomycetota bacterium]
MNASAFQFVRRVRGFSLVELLVIISIMAVLAAAGIPAIRNMIYTSSGSMAESQLRFGLQAARDLAIRSEGGDTAAVFVYEPGGRMQIIPMVYVGRILDTADPRNPLPAAPGLTTAYRDVFAPTALAEPMQLPAGWMIRGFAPPGSIFAPGANNSGSSVPSNGWYYENNPVGNRRINLGVDNISGQANKGNWVFPENGFYDPSRTNTGENRRNTFMIRFQSGSGRIVAASVTPAIVLLPRDTIDWNDSAARPVLSTATSPGDWRRPDYADNLPGWARSVIGMSNNADISAMIGCRSVDVAQACNVNLLALYDELRMAQTIGARGLNRVTGSIYGGAVGALNTANEVPKAPNIDLSLWPTSSPASSNAERVQMLVNNYMLNALRYSDVGSGPATNVDTDARLFRMDRYFGSAVETR